MAPVQFAGLGSHIYCSNLGLMDSEQWHLCNLLGLEVMVNIDPYRVLSVPF